MKAFTHSQRVVATWAFVLIVVAIVVSFPRMSGKLYPTFVTAGEHFQRGEPVYGLIPDGQDQYRYSPLVAATFAPWSHVPRPIGAILWRLLQAILLLIALRSWARVSVPSVPWPTLAILTLPLVLGNVYNAQVNPLVLALMLTGLTAFARGRYNWAAAAIVGAAIFKVYPLALGLLLCTIEPRRFAPRLFVAVVIACVSPFALQSPEYVGQQFRDWFERVGIDDRTNLSIHDGYHDFQRSLNSWGVPTSLSTYRLIEIGTGIAMAGVVIASRRQRVSRGKQVQLCAGLGLIWCTLFGPATESATYMLLAPIAAQAAAIAVRHGWLEKIWAFAAYLLMLSVPVVMWFPRDVSDPFRSLVPQADGAMMLLVWVVWQAGDRTSHTFPRAGSMVAASGHALLGRGIRLRTRR